VSAPARTTDKPKPSAHFFTREADGSVRLRIRFTPEEASKMEEAAGTTPLLHWIHRSLDEQAEADIAEARATRPKVRPE
jgi:hypothetical protein